ncbi:MAG TPA: alpha/beta hydrolase [Leptolyngbyaceae cyanobacterium M33_DOE_097]|nr:alpha/beta hydrolase [Leptolyngbyaceae cyanobacterium M33_DOE_097]
MVTELPVFLTPKNLRPHLPLFVFLPGLDGTGQLLRTQTDGLEVGFDVRCLAIPPNDQTSWERLAAQVVELIKTELKKTSDRPVYLCGESFGGCLALKVLAHQPSLFQRVILVNPASAFRYNPLLVCSHSLVSLVPESIIHRSAAWLCPFLIQAGRVSIEDRHALLQAVHSVPKKTLLWRLSLLSEFVWQEEQLQQIKQPVLLVAGGADQLLPSVSEVYRIANHIPTQKVVVLSHSGHACLLEKEVNLYQIMQDHHFIEELSAVGQH